MIRTFAVVALALLAGVVPAADKGKPPPGVVRLTVRVTGLFAPDRVGDLRAVFKDVEGVTLAAIDYEYAEAAVEFVPSTAFPGTKADDLPKRLDERVKAASHRTFGVHLSSGVARDKLLTVEVRVAGLDCKGCALAAYEAVAKVDGVEAATVDFKDGRVVARIDPLRTNRAAIEAALKKRGVSLPIP